MSFGYSKEFTVQAAIERRAQELAEVQRADETRRLIVRRKRTELILAAIYAVSMLVVVVACILSDNLRIAILAAGGLASMSVVYLIEQMA